MNRQARINREKGTDDEHRRRHYRIQNHERSHVETQAWRKEGQNSNGRHEGGQEKGQGNGQTEIEISAGSCGHEEGDRSQTTSPQRRCDDRRYRRSHRLAESQHPRLHQRKRFEEDGTCRRVYEERRRRADVSDWIDFSSATRLKRVARTYALSPLKYENLGEEVGSFVQGILCYRTDSGDSKSSFGICPRFPFYGVGQNAG